jgi:hypothetical protein
MGRNAMISRKARKLVPARELLQALTPAEMTEVSGGGHRPEHGGHDKHDKHGGHSKHRRDRRHHKRHWHL